MTAEIKQLVKFDFYIIIAEDDFLNIATSLELQIRFIN